MIRRILESVRQRFTLPPDDLLRGVRALPAPEFAEDQLGAEAIVPLPAAGA